MVSSTRFSAVIKDRIEARLRFLYGAQQAPRLTLQLLEKLQDFRPQTPRSNDKRWNQQDNVLITYGDSLRQSGEKPLQTLHRFLKEYLSGVIDSVHILPYFPYSSDDGFAVIDYTQVNPRLGTWEDIETIAQDFKLMTDLVINHVSSQHRWFQNFLKNRDPGRDYFIEVDPDTDLSMVVRPRTHPLLTRFETIRGPKWVWTTFSADQIDVNFQNPKVLFEFLDILLLYLNKGSQKIRLDAIAYLWKKIGTPCIHLPETHEVVKLLHDVVDQVAPATVLITETNVPHQENISYFGNGDEAHVVYQFPLPPLVLHAFYHADARRLTDWAKQLEPPPAGCTFLNFLACHDGIGLRPLEGLVPQAEINALAEAMKSYGGLVSMRANPDGSQSPYELNITWFSAMQGTCHGPDEFAVQRFLCSHAIMLALQGIPAVYILSLFATPNDTEGVQKTGAPRAINRHKWSCEELLPLLKNPKTPQAQAFKKLTRLLSLRRRQPAFHPDSPQTILDLGAGIVAVKRQSQKASQTILALHNVTPNRIKLRLPDGIWYNLLNNHRASLTLTLHSYQVFWLLEQSNGKPFPT